MLSAKAQYNQRVAHALAREKLEETLDGYEVEELTLDEALLLMDNGRVVMRKSQRTRREDK